MPDRSHAERFRYLEIPLQVLIEAGSPGPALDAVEEVVATAREADRSSAVCEAGLDGDDDSLGGDPDAQFETYMEQARRRRRTQKIAKLTQMLTRARTPKKRTLLRSKIDHLMKKQMENCQ